MTRRWVTVATVGEIPPGGVKVVRLDDQPLAVFHVDGVHHVIDDMCTHDGGELASGTVNGHEIECPRHGARFDLATGAALCMPATAPVARYPVRIESGQVQVEWS